MAGAVGRGSVVQTTINTIFFKPSIRKAYHRKSSTDTVMVETVKMDAEDEGNLYISNNKTKSDDDESEERWHCQQVMMMNNENSNSNSNSSNNIGWVPHEKTGIYYPKGQEKVMDNVPSSGVATKMDVDFTVNWFNSN